MKCVYAPTMGFRPHCGAVRGYRVGRPPADAQTLAGPQGRVFDASGAAVCGALIRVQDHATGFDASGRTDSDGRRYYLVAIPAGEYSVTAGASGFRSERIEALNVMAPVTGNRGTYAKNARAAFASSASGYNVRPQRSARSM